MAIQHFSLKEIVDRSVDNRFGMPEFQRGFVWSPLKVKEFVDSLYSEYPVGAMLLWSQLEGETPAVGRINATTQPHVWIVDGQQRTTSLCLMFGRKPYWWQDDATWKSKLEEHDIQMRVNPLKPEEVDFDVPKKNQGSDFVSLRKVLTADDSSLIKIANQLKNKNSEIDQFPAIFAALSKVRNIDNRQITAFVEDKDIEDIVEIFVRLNQNGTKVAEGDITNALVAGKNPRWTKDTFQEFLDSLEEKGFELDGGLIYRSLIAAERGLTRFKRVEDEFWAAENLNKAWPRVSKAWLAVIDGLHEYGILNSDVLTSNNVLIPLVVMAAHFPEEFRIQPALAWLIRAICTNRYSRTTDSRLAQDIAPFRKEGSDFKSAIETATGNLEELDFTAGDNEFFKKGFRDGGARLMLYLLAYDKKARDWGKDRERIGFSDDGPLPKFIPDWHHIFPRSYLKGNLDNPSDANSIANIAVTRKETPLKIGKKSPAEYMQGIKGIDPITDDLLEEQCIPTDRFLFDVEWYGEFLDERADLLAKAANAFMSRLTQG